MTLSIVSPVYRAEGMIEELVTRISVAAQQITPNYEIILVNDGSLDSSWQEIENEVKKSDKIIGINLSRNFGQHYAITAGLDHTSGDWVVVIDCDLQDRPEEILALYTKAISDNLEIVFARRYLRQDNWLKRMSSKFFYKTLSYISGTKQDAAIANFGIYKRNVIDAIELLREPIRYFPTMVKWVGFRSDCIDVEHAARSTGKTTYSWGKLLKLATDIILANSDKPLKLIVRIGFIISFVAFIIGVITIYRFFNHQIVVAGYTSLLISIWFLCGIILGVIGIVGLYVGKIFEAVKNRPIYLIKEKIKQ